MVSMVANLTLDKKGYEDFQADTRDILDQVMKGIGTLKELTLKEHGSLRRLHEMH
jgi:formiminotetrahydrofolate cyclodeaminase